MHIEIQNCFSFWGTSSLRPPTGASPLDPTGDFCPPDPLHTTSPHILYQVYAPDCQQLWSRIPQLSYRPYNLFILEGKWGRGLGRTVGDGKQIGVGLGPEHQAPPTCNFWLRPWKSLSIK